MKLQNEEMTLFATATRNKVRFSTVKGLLSTEDLWTLTLEQLDVIAKELNKELKETEVSFISSTKTNEILQLKFDIVKFIIYVKLAEKEEKKLKAEKLAKKNQLLELINNKENEKLQSLSLDELKKQLEQL